MTRPYLSVAGLAGVLLLLGGLATGGASALASPELCPIVSDPDSSCLTKVSYNIGNSVCDDEEGSQCVTCISQDMATCSIPEGAFNLSNATEDDIN